MSIDGYFGATAGRRGDPNFDIYVCWEDKGSEGKRMRGYGGHTDGLSTIVHDGTTTGKVIGCATCWCRY